MGTLIRFELRKIFDNRAGVAACLVALALLAALAALNLVTAQTRDPETGEVADGLAAQAVHRHVQESHAGVLDDGRVAADMAVLGRAHELIRETDGFYDLTAGEVMGTYGLEFWCDTYGVVNDGYYTQLEDVLDHGGAVAASLQQGARESVEAAVRGRFQDHFPYTDAEKDYWREKSAQVSWPIEYGYAGAWRNAFDWVSFSGLAIVALCIAVSGAFAGEYQSRTAAVALPTRRGKRALPAAKVVAALVFTTAYWWLNALVAVGINVAICGPDGAGLPFQVLDFGNPYALTAGGAVALLYALGYLVALGSVAFTLLLSAKMRSTMPVAVIPMAVVFLGVIALFFSGLAKVAALTPMSALNWSFSRMLSYSAGPLAADLPTVAALLYAALLVVCVPLAAHSFARHQVA